MERKKKRKGGYMKNKESWKTVIQIVVSVLSAILTTLTTTSCMGHGPF